VLSPLIGHPLLVFELWSWGFIMRFARACLVRCLAFVFHVIEYKIGIGQYIGADTYREGYASGPILNLCLPPGKDRPVCNKDLVCEVPPEDRPLEWTTIAASSRYVEPDTKQPKLNPSVTTIDKLIDGDITTKWWSAWDETEAWVQINLGSPLDRIKERDGYEFFTWKYKDNMEAGKDINYLKDGLIGFHIDTCIIRWDAWYAAMDYVVRSSMDDVQWKDRVVKQDMPTEYDRVDTLPGWSTQGIGNTRYVRFTYILRVYPKDAWGNTQIQPKPFAREKAPYGIREIELIGPEPSIACPTKAFGMLMQALLPALIAMYTLWFNNM
jgi:hypothetical protein